jgi:LysM repeat protein
MTNINQEDHGPEIQGTVQALLREAMVAQAAELAGGGQHQAAADLLEPLLALKQPLLPALDLAARVAARQGDLAKAADLWERAAALVPEERSYPRLARQTRRWQRWPRLWVPARLAGVALVTLLMVGSIVTLATSLERRVAHLPTGPATAGVQPTDMPTRLAPTRVASTPTPAAPRLDGAARASLAEVPAWSQLSVSQEGAGLRLGGRVLSHADLVAAAAHLAALGGVNWVDASGVTVAPPDLAARVTGALAADPSLSRVEVTQRGDGVVIHGIVTTEDERRVAEVVAGEIDGVAWVDARGLQVEPLNVASTLAAVLSGDRRTADLDVRVEDTADGVFVEGALADVAAQQAVLAVLREATGQVIVPVHLTLAPPERTYTVQPGDSLWGIASRLLNGERAWPLLYDLNRDVITRPELIHPGDVLRLPPD